MCNLSQYYVDKYSREGYEIGIQKGIEQGIINNTLTNITNLMSSLNISFDKAIEILKVSDDIKEDVIKLYNERYS